MRAGTRKRATCPARQQSRSSAVSNGHGIRVGFVAARSSHVPNGTHYSPSVFAARRTGSKVGPTGPPERSVRRSGRPGGDDIHSPVRARSRRLRPHRQGSPTDPPGSRWCSARGHRGRFRRRRSTLVSPSGPAFSLNPGLIAAPFSWPCTTALLLATDVPLGVWREHAAMPRENAPQVDCTPRIRREFATNVPASSGADAPACRPPAGGRCPRCE